jgi:DNA transposition AAA+ family ATPase
MTMETLSAKKPAPLKNVASFNGLVKRVVNRAPDLPGLAVFHGRSGLGKTKAAVYGANSSRATYVEVGQFTTAKSLLRSILVELGEMRPRGSVADMVEQAIMRLAADPTRPLIIDEAHWIAAKRFVDLLRELHDKSLAPVIMIGEETLPQQLEAFERVHNRVLEWVQAVPCDLEDARHLARSYCPDLKIAEDRLAAIVTETKGNTRRIVVALARELEEVRRLGRAA